MSSWKIYPENEQDFPEKMKQDAKQVAKKSLKSFMHEHGYNDNYIDGNFGTGTLTGNGITTFNLVLPNNFWSMLDGIDKPPISAEDMAWMEGDEYGPGYWYNVVTGKVVDDYKPDVMEE